MFGYVIANTDTLSKDELERYRACYCGLCRKLGELHSQASRFTLNYDSTFLVMLLSSLYEPETESGVQRCPVHLTSKHPYWVSKYTDYAADMNVLLAYYNGMDDWNDDRNLFGLVSSKVVENEAVAIREKYPRQAAVLEDCLAELSGYEKTGFRNPDFCSATFGKIMAELIVPDEDDYWAPTLRRMGYALGKYIYILDAYVDLQSDRRHNRFNPFSESYDTSEANIRSILTMLIAQCTDEFERLPLVQDVNIMRNILYSGVWSKFGLGRQYKGNSK